MNGWGWIDLIVAILATFRISELFTVDDGPGFVFDRLRRKAEQKANQGEPFESIAEILHCPWCMGVWVALFISVLPKKWRGLLIPFAIAGGQSVLQWQRKKQESQ